MGKVIDFPLESSMACFYRPDIDRAYPYIIHLEDYAHEVELCMNEQSLLNFIENLRDVLVESK